MGDVDANDLFSELGRRMLILYDRTAYLFQHTNIDQSLTYYLINNLTY